MHRSLLLALLGFLAIAPAARAGTGTCADPYWADTLRCKFFPAQTPQPAPPLPTTPAELRDYTRVVLSADLNIRCADGTRPVIYIDPAVGGPSNRWLITLTGGGSCAAGDLDHNGSFESGQSCALTYADPTERDEMGTANTPFMKNLGTSGQSDGIWSPDPVSNPVFSRFHRVRVEKCSYDRHTGRATHAGLTATAPGGPSINYTLYQHGQKIVLMALEALRGQGAGNPGLSYTTLVANGGALAPTTVTLPSMADATQVVILGHSGAAHGLYHNADRYAQRLRSWPGFQGDVRAVHDANFQASTESEAIFDPGQSAGLFDQVYSGNTAELGAYNAVPFYSDSIFTEQARAWLEQPGDGPETIFDASCVAAHQSAGDTWKCRDKWHVRFHHETTPVFLREDFSDPGGDHTNNGQGYDVSWGPLGAYPHCAKIGFTPCPPRMATGPGSPYVARLNAQAQDYLQHILTDGELASGADPSGPPPTTYLWMPNCGTHAGAYDNGQYQDARLLRGPGGTNMRQWLELFVAAPATGVALARIDGSDGYLSECGPRLGASGFE